jgi:peroxiredoxin
MNPKSFAFLFLLAFFVFPPHAATDPQAADPFKALELIRPSRVQQAKAFSVPAPDGKSVKLLDLTGKVVLLNFWATWCPPCREEMPAMERLYHRYKDQGLMVLALSVDAEGAPVVLPFLKEHKLSFPVGLDPKMAVADRYGVRALPSTFLVDRKGNLVALAIGPRQWDGKSAHGLIELLLK